MPGVFEVRSVAPVGQAIDDLILLAECSFEGEWEGQVRFLPSEIVLRLQSHSSCVCFRTAKTCERKKLQAVIHYPPLIDAGEGCQGSILPP